MTGSGHPDPGIDRLRITVAGPEDGPAISGVLTGVDLPTPEDLADDTTFWMARDGDRVVGCAGLEIFGDVGLLRSVAVSAADHGRGIGSRLVREVLAYAGDRDLRELVLLTLSASAFFADHGFEAVDRATVQGAVSRSWEFRHHACDAAVCMRRGLREGRRLS